MSKSLELETIRQQLLQIDFKILESYIERETLLGELTKNKGESTPIYLPEVEKIKLKKLIDLCKKKIEEIFQRSCQKQIKMNRENSLFTVDQDCFLHDHLKEYATFDLKKAKYILTSKKTGPANLILIHARTTHPQKRGKDPFVLVAKNKGPLFRQKLTIYGGESGVIRDLKSFLESIGNHVTVRS
jgi:chorismate mutase